MKSLQGATRIRFCSEMKSYDDQYIFRVEGVNRRDSPIAEEHSRSVGNFFDSEGYLHYNKVNDMLDTVLKNFSRKTN